MKLQKNNSGFTLIELIVVITILAILGTIAFISLQGYSAGARNSKRLSDIGNITTQMNIKRTDGVELLNFVNRVDTNGDTVATGTAGAYEIPTSISLAGKTILAADYGKEYAAGVPNYLLLGIKKEEFSDPDGPEYRMAVTTTGEGRYQFATIKEVDGIKNAYLAGDYVPRKAATTIQATSSTAAKEMSIKTNIGYLKVGDTVDDAVTVDSISDSLTSLTFSAAPTLSDTDKITLDADEAKGLIKSVADVPVEHLKTTDDGTASGDSVLPY
ncbi:MAG: type II secretion system GspH family protein [Candidatus Gracilibacteria bacterium]|nr:type II secretion system GspH family protein [Candidatus Gracilibacteria bacterium]